MCPWRAHSVLWVFTFLFFSFFKPSSWWPINPSWISASPPCSALFPTRELSSPQRLLVCHASSETPGALTLPARVSRACSLCISDKRRDAFARNEYFSLCQSHRLLLLAEINFIALWAEPLPLTLTTTSSSSSLLRPQQLFLELWIGFFMLASSLFKSFERDGSWNFLGTLNRRWEYYANVCVICSFQCLGFHLAFGFW